MQSIDGGADVICRAWYGADGPREVLMSTTMYRGDMIMNSNLGETMHRWTGEDRNGRPLTVTWLPSPRFGTATLWVYEISGASS